MRLRACPRSRRSWIGPAMPGSRLTPCYARTQGRTLFVEPLSTGGNVGGSASGQGRYHTNCRNPAKKYAGVTIGGQQDPCTGHRLASGRVAVSEDLSDGLRTRADAIDGPPIPENSGLSGSAPFEHWPGRQSRPPFFNSALRGKTSRYRFQSEPRVRLRGRLMARHDKAHFGLEP